MRTAYLLLTDEVRRSTRYNQGMRLSELARLGAQAVPGTAQLVALAARTRADVVHTNGLKAHVLGGLAGRIALRPVIWHVRDFPPEGDAGPGAARRLEDAAEDHAHQLRRGGGGVASRWQPQARAPHRQSGGPGALPSGSRRAGRSNLCGPSWASPPTSPWWGWWRTSRRGRGTKTFSAWRRRCRVPGFWCQGVTIYETEGHAGYSDRLRRRAVDLGLGGSVHFLGNRDDVPEILAALDVLVHCPTAPEPFGRAVAEAMAVGKPVVAARAGGLPEIVEHEVTGLLVPPGDVAACAAAVTRLLVDPDAARATWAPRGGCAPSGCSIRRPCGEGVAGVSGDSMRLDTLKSAPAAASALKRRRVTGTLFRVRTAQSV